MWHDRFRNEDGVALVFAMLATLVITGLVTVMMARALTETRMTSSARDREAAIHVAEAGIDHVIVDVNVLDDHVTTAPDGTPHEFTPDLTSDLAEQKAWALEVASDDTRCDVVPTAGGETCGIRPAKLGTELPWIFGVGFVPSRAEAEKVRVVKIQFDKGFFSPEKAILTNGDLSLASTICGAAADVHTNGTVTLKGGADTVSCADPDGNVTGTGGYVPNGTVGPDSGQVPRTIPIPQIRAETVYAREAAAEAAKDDPSTSAYEGTWFDLCSDGIVRAPLVDGSGELVRDASGRVQPCAGTALSSDSVNYVGWQFLDGVWESTPRVIPDGVYYVHHANAEVSGNLRGASGVVNMSVVVDAVGQIVGQPDTGDCDTRDGAASGNISLTGVGGGEMNPYLQDMLFLVDGDFVNAGNNSTTLHGVVLAHEQISLGGTATYTGAIISEGACDSTNSPVPFGGNVATGNFRLTHNGDLALPLDSLTRITAWNEL